MQCAIRTVVYLAVAVSVMLASPATAAAAEGDTIPPTVTLEPFARYVVGTSADTYYDDVGNLDTFVLRMRIRWRAADASGICGQTLTEQSYDTFGGDTDPILGGHTAASSLPAGVRSYSFVEEGQNYWRIPHSFVVRVTDCAGNTAASRISTTSINIDEDSSPIVSYVGQWGTSHFRGFSAGTTRFNSTAGARAAFQVDGGPVAVVMEKAANRGSAKILVDGVLRATVDTSSPTTMHRQVVWQALLPAGRHTVKVVNSATAGHPRIDLDLVLN